MKSVSHMFPQDIQVVQAIKLTRHSQGESVTAAKDSSENVIAVSNKPHREQHAQQQQHSQIWATCKSLLSVATDKFLHSHHQTFSEGLWVSTYQTSTTHMS